MPSLRKEDTVNCWEYKNCPEEVFSICPAYPNSGSVCYRITGVKCLEGNAECASVDEQVAYCGRCNFYAQIARRAGYEVI